ncbi:DNA repair protein RecO [Corynebacterium lizhenjunii]|uniref:DNA repair protein RecO n=1 Tax=Corynebacterium lizhenjunii TaxID=2709394 RepID=A0A7T0KE60_9CORY|nr:DNA repair protein RecO [Corynebacterium lizhenjunii]QPK78610.1 DNA repair protein RecO [Corynebacterium lizhenjunii]
MARDSFRDRAVVIRSYDFGEADRVIVLLTRAHGVVRAVAKGVRRAKSRFGSRLQYFVELDVQFYQGRNLHTITQADTLAYFGAGIIEDYDRYACACAALEIAEKLSGMEADEDPYLYDALVAALAAFQRQDPTQVLDRFLLQSMRHAGWAPQLFECAACQAPGPHHAFHPAVGGAACVQCRPPGAAEVDPETLHHLWLLLQGYHSQATPEQVTQGHRLARAHLQWHIESKVAALSVLEHEGSKMGRRDYA